MEKIKLTFMKTTFKQFHPKVDKKRRLVLTRIYTGIKGSNNFCYRIDFINQKGDINKRVKPLYAFGNDDFSNVKEFKHAGNGEPTKVFKSAFKTVYGVSNKVDAITIWSKANK
jgi:hypothetical protein